MSHAQYTWSSSSDASKTSASVTRLSSYFDKCCLLFAVLLVLPNSSFLITFRFFPDNDLESIMPRILTFPDKLWITSVCVSKKERNNDIYLWRNRHISQRRLKDCETGLGLVIILNASFILSMCLISLGSLAIVWWKYLKIFPDNVEMVWFNVNGGCDIGRGRIPPLCRGCHGSQLRQHSSTFHLTFYFSSSLHFSTLLSYLTWPPHLSSCPTPPSSRPLFPLPTPPSTSPGMISPLGPGSPSGRTARGTFQNTSTLYDPLSNL